MSQQCLIAIYGKSMGINEYFILFCWSPCSDFQETLKFSFRPDFLVLMLDVLFHHKIGLIFSVFKKQKM